MRQRPRPSQSLPSFADLPPPRQDRPAGATLRLVVPLFNEETRVAEAFGHLVAFIDGWPPGSQLVFVDDGSTDDTAAVVDAAIRASGSETVSLLRRPHLGKGAAIRHGLSQAPTDLGAFCDVDLSTPLAELQRIITAAAAAGGLAIGSRALAASKIDLHESRRREIAGRAFNRLVRVTLCPGIADTQCGAKAAPIDAWDAILPDSRENGFAWDVEVIALAMRSAIAVLEIGVIWNHDERTRVRVWRDGFAMVTALLRVHSNVAPARPVLTVPDPTPSTRWSR